MDTNERERSNDESPKTSRRTFLATAAGAAGAAGAVGTLLGRSADASVAFAAAPLATSIATARELLYLDGAAVGFLSGRSGGLPFVEVPSSLTTGAKELKPLGGTVRFEPLVLQVGIGMAGNLSQWVVDSMQLKGIRKSGFIALVSFDGNETGRLNFTNALISEVTLPSLDAANGKDSVALTITLVPEFTQLFLAPSSPVKHTLTSQKSKLWLASNYRLHIDGIDAKRVSVVESQTTTIKMTTPQLGVDKFPTTAPVGIENGKLVITIPEADARQFLDWFNQLWGSPGKPPDPAALRSGTLEYLTTDLKTVIGTVTFKNVAIAKIAPQRLEAATDTIRRVKIEMYVGSTAIDPKSFA